MKDYKVDKASLSASFCQEVYQVVREIPVGKVSTYGGIAALLGMSQCSRMVGRALKQIPDDLSAPVIGLSMRRDGLFRVGQSRNNSCWKKGSLSNKMDA